VFALPNERAHDFFANKHGADLFSSPNAQPAAVQLEKPDLVLSGQKLVPDMSTFTQLPITGKLLGCVVRECKCRLEIQIGGKRGDNGT
jgi:hypothetical protein